MFIANKGNSQTKIYNNNDYKLNNVKWDAKYDGKIADINLDINNDGNKKNVHMSLNNEELADLLNVPSVGDDLQKRLKNDFKYNSLKKKYIELEGGGGGISKETNKNIFSKKYSKKYSVKRNKKNHSKTMRIYFRNPKKQSSI